MPEAGSQSRCVDAVTHWIEQAAADGAQVICLQELFHCRYPCQSEDHRRFDFAEPLDGPTINAMSALAAKHQVVIVAPIFERRGAGLYHNTAVVLDADGSVAGVYRKMHIPDDPHYF
ncbi:MAG: acyltransferase, partial [Pirellulales bacterium]|nr:acyltransferase [Pirellulales bacterium]